MSVQLRNSPSMRKLMTIPIELSDPETEKLRSEAQRLGVDPQALAAAAVRDLLNRETTDFEQAAKYVLRKNQELYKRLA